MRLDLLAVRPEGDVHERLRVAEAGQRRRDGRLEVVPAKGEVLHRWLALHGGGGEADAAAAA